ncbi:MAG: PHB depolymerase family esterase, partial [Myxococcota bacterium]
MRDGDAGSHGARAGARRRDARVRLRVARARARDALSRGRRLRARARAARRRAQLHRAPAPDYPTRAPLPLLFAFHGGGGNASGFQAYAGLDAPADARGFAVVYPNGSGRFAKRLLTWNAGDCCAYAQQHEADDVGFALAILADLARDLPLDRTRVYATGHSNGGMMSYRLAAEAATRIAAIAPVAGADMTRTFAPEAPVAVLHVHSVDDPRALYAGGPGPANPLGGTRIEHRAAEAGLDQRAHVVVVEQ